MFSRGDSISGFSTTQELYSATASPREVLRQQQLRGELTTRPTDTIERSKDRHERQVPCRVGESSQKRAGEVAFKVARAGRFIFMAVALPAYLAVYKIPKWVAVIMAPKAAQIVELSFIHAKKFIQQINRWMAHQMTRAYKLVGGWMQWVKTKIFDKSLALFNRLMYPFRHLKRFFERSRNRIGERGRRFSKKTYEAFNKVEKHVQQLSKRVFELTALPIAQSLMVFLALLGKLFRKIGAWVVRRNRGLFSRLSSPFPSLSRWVSKLMNWLSKMNRSLEKGLDKLFTPIVHLFAKLSSVASRGVSRFMNFFKGALWKLHLKVQTGIALIPPFLDKLENKLVIVGRRFFKWVDGVLSRFFSLPPFIFVYQTASRLSRGAVRALQFLYIKVTPLLLEPIKKLLSRLPSPKGRMGPVSPVFASVLKKGLLLVRLLGRSLLGIIRGVVLFFYYSYEMLEEVADQIGPDRA